MIKLKGKDTFEFISQRGTDAKAYNDTVYVPLAGFRSLSLVCIDDEVANDLTYRINNQKNISLSFENGIRYAKVSQTIFPNTTHKMLEGGAE